MSPSCRVIAIFSMKGGVGKTVVAANLAATLRVRFGRRVALLELTPSTTDAAMMLGTTEVTRVSAPITKETLPGVITELSGAHDFVVIDAGSILSESAVTAFEHSNLLLIVMGPDVISLHHTTRTIELLEALKFPLRMIRVILNRAESHGNFRSREIKEQSPVPVIAEIPSDGRLVSLSVNQATPLVVSEAGSRIQRSFTQLAQMLLEGHDLFVERTVADRSKLPPAPEEVAGIRSNADGGSLVAEVEDPIAGLKRRIHARLIEKFDLKRLDLKALNDPQKARPLKERAEKVALELLAEEAGISTGRLERERLVREIVDEALGLGPLEEFMADQTISDILVNGKDRIYIERQGKLSLTGKRFLSNDQVLSVIERIIAPLGRRIDESTPMVDARLPDGSRVNAIIAPLSLRGPMLSIRKFTRERYTMEDLIRFGTLTPAMAAFISTCVAARKNIIVSGGTGSGKTTILNVLSACIPKGERILTIEDAAELQLNQEHWVPLEARMANVEGRGAVTMRLLFRNALRMRPDRIIIGECRGEETLDMLQAMNTGHDGSLTTLHANSPQDVISRLDSLVLMSNVDLPVRAVREQVVSAIDLIVHTARFSDGSRKVTQVTEITGMDERADVSFADLFVFRQQGLGPNGEVLGAFRPTGHRPSFLEELTSKGLSVDETVFSP